MPPPATRAQTINAGEEPIIEPPHIAPILQRICNVAKTMVNPDPDSDDQAFEQWLSDCKRKIVHCATILDPGVRPETWDGTDWALIALQRINALLDQCLEKEVTLAWLTPLNHLCTRTKNKTYFAEQVRWASTLRPYKATNAFTADGCIFVRLNSNDPDPQRVSSAIKRTAPVAFFEAKRGSKRHHQRDAERQMEGCKPVAETWSSNFWYGRVWIREVDLTSLLQAERGGRKRYSSCSARASTNSCGGRYATYDDIVQYGQSLPADVSRRSRPEQIGVDQIHADE